MPNALHFKFIFVGKMKDPRLRDKAAEYFSWLSGKAKCEVVEVKDSRKETECAEIMRRLKETKGLTVIMSEEGREYSSVEFAAFLKKVDTKVTFVIGGADGLTDEVKQSGDLLWSLSKLTFPHEVARMLLFEQLFRANDINSGGKYHRA